MIVVSDSLLSELVGIYRTAHSKIDLGRAADRIRAGDKGRTTQRLARSAATAASQTYTNCRDKTQIHMLYAAASAAEAIRMIASGGPQEEIEAEIGSARSHANKEIHHVNERALRSG